MKHFLTAVLKTLVCYLLAGAAYLLYFKWPHYEGHAHVPFSEFPAFLIWAPLAPYFLIESLFDKPVSGVFDLLVFGSVFGGSLWLFFKDWKNAQP